MKRTRGHVLASVVRRLGDLRADWSLALLDAVCVVLAYEAVLLLDLNGLVPPVYADGLRDVLPAIVLVHVGANAVTGQYGRIWAQAGVMEARRFVLGGALAVAAVPILVMIAGKPVHLVTAVFGSTLSLLILGAPRFRARLFGHHRQRDDDPEPARPIVVVGAGDAAGSLIRDMLEDPRCDFLPVAVLDDDRRTHGRTIGGVPIIGGISTMRRAALVHGATLAVLAVPSASGALVRRVADLAKDTGLELKVLPTVADLVGAPPRVRDVRDLSIEDLLGRAQVATDLALVRNVIAGKRMLITGAGGSIGSEIARQVATLGPAELILLDHDETHLHEVAAELPGSCTQVLADVRDSVRVDRVFREYSPDIVFHAAAHKHVPVLEDHPCEGILTNVGGTHNVLRSATASRVSRFVFISTDKAVRPANVMGATKRMGEQLTLRHAADGTGRYCAVRFGNVLASRGSVIPTFMQQIEHGGPVTVTHPEVTRYFMSIPEAVQLVLQAMALAEGGEVFMLDMGEPVRILDLAQRMISMCGRDADVDVAVTGLRPGEKLVEELSAPDERMRPTSHPSISALAQLRPDPRWLDESVERLVGTARRYDDDRAAALLFELVSAPTIVPTAADGEGATRARSGARGRSAPLLQHSAAPRAVAPST